MSNRVNKNIPHFNLSRSLPLTKLLTLPRTIKERSFSFTVLEVVERLMSVIQLLLPFMQMGMSLSVLPLQLFQPFFSRLIKLHIHVSRSLFPLMIPLPVTLKGMTTSMRFSNVQNSSFGIKLLCSMDMALKP